MLDFHEQTSDRMVHISKVAITQTTRVRSHHDIIDAVGTISRMLSRHRHCLWMNEKPVDCLDSRQKAKTAKGSSDFLKNSGLHRSSERLCRELLYDES